MLGGVLKSAGNILGNAVEQRKLRNRILAEIKEDIVYILERLDYADGSWDSIRYVKGGKIDKVRNK